MKSYATVIFAVCLSAVTASPQQYAPTPSAAILSQQQELNPDGSFYYGFESSNGIKSESKGTFQPIGPEEGILRVSGSNYYIGDDGKQHGTSYTADENGYNAVGPDIPVPPPIPAELVKSVQEALADQTQYDQRGFPIGGPGPVPLRRIA